MYNLKARHVVSKPYTRTGDIVIAVNPYKWLLDLYTEERRHIYSTALVFDNTYMDNEGDPRSKIEPHVYEASSLAYRGLAVDGADQSILVSGESGAGKTETVKILMNDLASVQRHARFLQRESSVSNLKRKTTPDATDASGSPQSTSVIVQRVLDSNPLLEAFGNAKTLRNDNSSRFGKYVQLQFHGEDPEVAARCGKQLPSCVLAGSKCEVYLLEKSRVVSHEEEERTFHIFYQLLNAPEEVKMGIWEGLEETDNESYSYVGYTETSTIEGLADEARFQHTVDSLELVGVAGDTLKMLMRAICIVLQLGNLVFEPQPKDEDKSDITSTEELAGLSDLMGVPKEDLIAALTLRTVRARGEEYKVPLNPEKARDSTDAFAKEIYAKTFLWLVRQINDATCAENNYDGDKMDGFGVIGLLDIFGFESFHVNRFEQLCINYANEKLQQKFTQDIFRSVQAEYEYEGIELGEITYDDNTDVLDLVEGRMGLLSFLNEECVRPKVGRVSASLCELFTSAAPTH
jgi:myosin V